MRVYLFLILLCASACDRAPPPAPPKEKFIEPIARAMALKQAAKTGVSPTPNIKNVEVLEVVAKGEPENRKYIVDAKVSNVEMRFYCTRILHCRTWDPDARFRSESHDVSSQEFERTIDTWRQKQELDRERDVDAARERAKRLP